MNPITRKVATAWRSFLSSEEGQEGLQYILSQRPPLDERQWQRAAGFEEFKRRIDEILEFESARGANSTDESDSLKS